MPKSRRRRQLSPVDENSKQDAELSSSRRGKTHSRASSRTADPAALDASVTPTRRSSSPTLSSSTAPLPLTQTSLPADFMAEFDALTIKFGLVGAAVTVGRQTGSSLVPSPAYAPSAPIASAAAASPTVLFSAPGASPAALSSSDTPLLLSEAASVTASGILSSQPVLSTVASMPVVPVLSTPDQRSTILAAPVLPQLSTTAHPPLSLYDWDPPDRETVLKTASRPRFTESSGMKIRAFLDDVELFLRLCGRPRERWGLFVLQWLGIDEATRFDAAILWIRSQRTTSLKTGSLPSLVALSLKTVIVRCCARFVNRAPSQWRQMPHARPTYVRVRIHRSRPMTSSAWPLNLSFPVYLILRHASTFVVNVLDVVLAGIGRSDGPG